MGEWRNDIDRRKPNRPDEKKTLWRPPQTSREMALDRTGLEPYPFRQNWVTFSAENIST